MKHRLVSTLTISALIAAFAGAARAAEPVTVRMSAGPSMLVQLADSLGYFHDEGIRVEVVDYHQFVPEDCQIYLPLNDGRLDASLHWFQHVFMGAGEGKPIEGVMLFNDAPGMSVLVANRVKAAVKSAADFKGRAISEGVPLSTKSFITNYLTVRAGLPPHRYRSVLQDAAGRQAGTIVGLRQGTVDIVTCMEPQTSAYLATGLASKRYDFGTKESTTRELGASLPAQCLLIAPSYAAAHPETVQKLINAFVRTMRFVNAHPAEEIVAQLPPSYFAKTSRKAALRRIKELMPTFARGDYAFASADVALIRDAVFADTLVPTEEGRLRGDTKKLNPPLESYYDDRFVMKAMAADGGGAVTASNVPP